MKNKVTTILCGLALFVTGTLPAFTPQWNENIILEKSEQQQSYWLKSKDKKQFYGGVSGKRNVDFSKIKVWIQENRIHVDMRNAFTQKNGFADITFKIPLYKVNLNSPVCFTMDIGGTPGLAGDIGLNGELKNKTHYWNNKPFLVTDGNELKTYEKRIPNEIRSVHLIARMRTPGIYTFGQATCAPKKEDSIDPKMNLIVNGGAERGWYSSGVNNMLNNTAAAKYDTWWGINVYRYPLLAEIDTNEKLSGKASFKFTVKHDKPQLGSDSHNVMHFNQVPVIMGKPVLLTLWMKADQPGRKALIRLHYAPGQGWYGMNATLDTEWKKYQLAIPSMGNKPAKGWLAGSFNNHEYQLITPRIEFQTPGTFWIDNAAFFIADKGEYKEDTLNISGTLNKDSTYYFTGEPIKTTLTVSSTDPNKKSIKLLWNLYDFFGKKVAESQPETVSLINGRAEKTVTLHPPKNLRGALNWELVADETIHNYYLGIIDRSEKMSPRLGVNLSRHNADLGSRYLKDFRYSSVRIWQFYGQISGLDLIEPYHKNGFYTLLCLERTVPSHTQRYLFPKDLEPWKKQIREIATKYKGMIDAYEIFNEPNARAGMGKNPDAEKYEHITPETNAKIIKTAAETIRPIDSAVKIAGPTTCHTDISWTSNVLAQGAWKYLDIITEHPYHTLPEVPDYAETLNTMRKNAEKYGKKFPVFATERGTMIPANPENNHFNDRTRKATAIILRTMILCYAGGNEKFFDFSFGTSNYAITYNMVFSGNPDNNYMPKPGYAMYASKALADRIENAPMVKQVKLGLLFRCYIFDHGNKRTAVIWKWNGKPEKITFSRNFDIYDFMGTKTTAKTIELSEFPCYVETNLSTEEFAKEIAAADLKLSGDRIHANLNIKNSRQFTFEIKNITGKHLPSGTVRILTNNLTKQKTLSIPTIPPEGKVEVLCDTQHPIGLDPIPLKAEIDGKQFEFQLKGLTAVHMKKDPVIDGKLDDWKNVPVITLTGKKNSFRYKNWSAEEESAKTELQFSWNTNGLYMAVTVYKKGFHPVDVNGTSATWLGDGLQVGMDTLKNSVAGVYGYLDDDFEYDIAMFKGKPLVNRNHGSLEIHDSLNKKIGPVDDVLCAIDVQPGKVTYELAFKPFTVSPFLLKSGESMRISVIANINNGKERIGYLQLTPGLGVAKKDPSQFIDIFLEK